MQRASFRLTTPPPSVNDMYVPTGRGQLKLSQKGRAWINQSSAELMNQGRGIGGDPAYWRASYMIPGAERKDIGNYEKALTDLLVKAELVPDDRYLCDIRLRFYDGKTVEIAVKTEDLNTWAIIRAASKSLTRKLAKFSR